MATQYKKKLEIDHKIIITGIICLTIIELMLLITNHTSMYIRTVIIGIIAFAIGIILPTPKFDNRRGVLIW